MELIERLGAAGSQDRERSPEVAYTDVCDECCEEFESTAADPFDVTCPVCGSDCVSPRLAVY